MSADRVRVELEDHVARVTLTRADKHNALDLAMFDALIAAAERVRSEDGVRAIVISGEGPSFCSGLDFASILASGGTDVLRERLAAALPNYFQLPVHGWLTQPAPVIAALHGHCLGGGLQLALAADIRIAAPDTRLGLLETRWGLIPDMAITRTLPRLVGIDQAKRMIYTAEQLDGAQALRIGLVTELAADPLAAALALASTIAARSPDAVRAAKLLVDRGWDGGDAPTTLALEAELQSQLVGTPNQLAAIAAGLSGGEATYGDPAT